MKPTTIEFSFDDAKLDAINIFLKEKNATLSGELDRFMDALYKKYVPQAVREFIEKKEAEDAKASPPQRPIRKKPNADRNAVSDDETGGGANTRPSGETPTQAISNGV